jgi:hypothetical protein
MPRFPLLPVLAVVVPLLLTIEPVLLRLGVPAWALYPFAAGVAVAVGFWMRTDRAE